MNGEHGQRQLEVPHGRQGQGRPRLRGGPALRGVIRPPRLLPARGRREAGLAGVRPGASRLRWRTSTRRRPSPTAASTSAGRTARSTRTARRPERCAGRTTRAATSTPRRRSTGSGSTPARTAGSSSPSTLRPATSAGSSTRTPRSRARPRSWRDRLLRDARQAHVRAERSDRQAGVDVSRRRVLAGRGGQEAHVPGRSRTALRPDSEAEALGLAPVTAYPGSFRLRRPGRRARGRSPQVLERAARALVAACSRPRRRPDRRLHLHARRQPGVRGHGDALPRASRTPEPRRSRGSRPTRRT